MHLNFRGDDIIGNSICFSSDGKFVAVGGFYVVHVFDAITGKKTFAETLCSGDWSKITGVAFSPDGRRLAAVVFHTPHARYTLEIFDLRAQKKLHHLPGPDGQSTNVVFSPDGGRFAVGGLRGTVTVHDTFTGKVLLTLRGTSASSLAFTEDGRRILVGGWDNGFRVFDARVGSDLLSLAQLPGLNTLESNVAVVDPRAAALSPDGQRLALLDSMRLRVLDTSKAVPLFQANFAPGEEAFLSYSSDNPSRLLVADRTQARIYDAQGQVCFGRPGLTALPVVGPKGQHLLLASADGVEVRELGAGKRISLLEQIAVQAVQNIRVRFSLCGRWVAIMHAPEEGCFVSIWEVETGKRVFHRQFRTWRVVGAPLEFSADSRWIIVSADRDEPNPHRAVVAWEWATGKEVFSHVEPEGVVGSIATSPRGNLLAWSVNVLRDQLFTGLVRVAETDTGRVRHLLRGHDDSVGELVFSSDGERLLTHTSQFIRVWDVANGQNVLTLEGSMSRAMDPLDPSSGRSYLGNLQDLLGMDHLPVNHERAFRLAHFQPEPGWHERSARKAEERKDWTSAVFHLERMLLLVPDDAALQDRLSQARKKLAPGTQK